MLVSARLTNSSTLTTYLLWNLPQALQSAVHVAAPQHDAAIDHNVAALGTSRKGRDKAAPMFTRMPRVTVAVVMRRRTGCET